MNRLKHSRKLFRYYSSISSTLKEVFTNRNINQEVKVRGWVKTNRNMKMNIFADINDGSTGENLQLVCDKSDKAKLGFGSSVEALGVLCETPKGQLEVKVKNLKLLGDCPLCEGYPFVARQSYAPEYIRENLHFRSRVSTFNAMIRCRHSLTNIINNYLNQEGFLQIHTPVLTANDCEGAGEVFNVKPDSEDLLREMRRGENDKSETIFFDHKVFLSVSGQLHLEAMAHGLSKVYTFGPTFRAENSKSPIHLSEFYMLELEESFIESIDDVIKTISKMFKNVSREFADKCSADVLIINKSNKEFNIDEHFNWIDKDFKVLTFKEAYEIVERNKDKFLRPPHYDDGLSKEQEIFIANHCNGPCFIIDWPKNQKSFYMREKKENQDIVEALDFIVPGVGEIAGGSVREDNYELLKAKMPDYDSLKWYLDLRKYGNVTTGGFGLGFERYIKFLLNIHSIRDVIPFPRWAHNCNTYFTMDSETKSRDAKKKYRKIPVNNSFIRDKHIWDRDRELYDKIKTVSLSILLLPIRLIVMVVLLLIAWCFAYVGLYGCSQQDLKLKPLKGWRGIIRRIVGFLFRSLFFFGSAHWVTVKGKLAPAKDAPILVCAPHSSFYDSLAVLMSGPSSVVGKIEASQIPFYGKLIDMAQPIYVNREDHGSRTRTIQDILDRVKSPEDWPHILIFPEGTCTNRQSLIRFKPGAFYPGQKVQPVLIRYPNKTDTLTWTWQGPHVAILLWKTLAQFHNFVEIEYLPVYTPSDEEIKNPKLYASNVQHLMADALNLPVADYTFDDCKLMDYASGCKLKFAEFIADIAKFREKIGLTSTRIEEHIVRDNFKGTEDYYVNFEEFHQRLKIPADDMSYTLFSLFNPSEKDVINFKEYLHHALLLIKIQDAKIELVRLLFLLYGDSGKLQREPFKQILNHLLKISPSKLDQLFCTLDRTNSGLIVFEDFRQATETDERFKRLYTPNRNFRQN